jgi:hypothetical protein
MLEGFGIVVGGGVSSEEEQFLQVLGVGLDVLRG